MAGYTFDKSARNRLAGRWAGRYLRFVKTSSSMACEPEDPSALLRELHPCIVAMWHGQFLLLAPLAPNDLPFANMVARHGDAELIGEALKTFDMQLIRGGGAAGRRKDRGGAQAFREALTLLENGTSIAMTADVPPGPARRAWLGIVKLAAHSGRPIIPVAVASSRFRALDTWSRMTINLPFSTIGFAHTDPIWVPPHADQAALNAARDQVEAGLNTATDRAYALAGSDSRIVLPHAALTPDHPPAKSSTSLRLYRTATRLLTPAMPYILKRRERHGKEDPARRPERLGMASKPRPDGPLVWLHAASVGEANAVLPLIAKLRERDGDRRFLLTTGTTTSAVLAEKRLDPCDIHQFAPLDIPAYIKRFLDHWKPDLIALTESEIWPNTIIESHDRKIPIVLANARMSDRSYKRWRRNKRAARPLFGRLRLILAQNERLARRFRELGGRDVRIAGNIKIDAPILEIDPVALAELRSQIGRRPVFLAASTHPGEDQIVIDAFNILRNSLPPLLLIIVPRHPDRGTELMKLAMQAGLDAGQRSAHDTIADGTTVYVADTMGELGLFYAIARVALVGGSLVERGGQNPIEAIRLGCPVITGPSQHNFLDIYSDLRRASAVLDAQDASSLADAAINVLLHDARREDLQTKAESALSKLGGGLKTTTDLLDQLLENTQRPNGQKQTRLTRAT